MTQSGQGNEPQPPAAPPAHEGVVMPSAGLRHGGAQGDPWAAEQAAPAEGQPWGDPWGPDVARPPQGPPPGAPGEPTQMMMPAEPVPGQALPPAGYGQDAGRDAEATQLMPPVGGPIPGAPMPGGAGPMPGPMPSGGMPDGSAPAGALPLPAEGVPFSRPEAPPGAGYGAQGLPLPAEGQPFPYLQPHQGQQQAHQQGQHGQQPAHQQAQSPRHPEYPHPGPAPGYPQPDQASAYPPHHAPPAPDQQWPEQSGQYPPQQPHPDQFPADQSAGYPGQPDPLGSYQPQAEQPAPYRQPEAQPHTQILRAQPPAPSHEQGHTHILRPQQQPPSQGAAHTQILRPQPPAPDQQQQPAQYGQQYGQQHGQQPYQQPQEPQEPQSGQRQPQPELRKRPESPAESTTMLRMPDFGDGPPPAGPGTGDETQVLPGPIPSAAAGQPQHQGGAQYAVRPGTPGERPPPAEFDSLFRSDERAESPDSTQQLPLYNDGAPGPQPAQQGPYPPPGSYGQGQQPSFGQGPQPSFGQGPQPSFGQGPPTAGYEPQGTAGDGGGGRRRSRRGVVIGAVVAACVVAGLAAGAAISLGGDDKKDGEDESSKSDKDVVASDSPAPSKQPTKAPDPAEPQAKALDGLLKDSNSSRASVIASVNNIRSCKALPTAARDLRAAARQRNALVTRLGQISVDKLPQHAELTQALTKAWKSSASADAHYAAWADEASKKKGCHKGKAHNTGHTASGNRASGEASAAKKQAAELWNPIARKYTLAERRAEQL